MGDSFFFRLAMVAIKTKSYFFIVMLIAVEGHVVFEEQVNDHNLDRTISFAVGASGSIELDGGLKKTDAAGIHDEGEELGGLKETLQLGLEQLSESAGNASDSAAAELAQKK